jgi:uncharacterized protein (TIGR03086 family)
MTPAERYRQVAAAFTDRVRNVTDDGWSRPAPPDGWAARDVVGHLTEWFPAFLSAGTGITLPQGPSVTDDPVANWTTVSDGVQQLLDDPGTADRFLDHPVAGRHQLDQAIHNFFTSDVFMHTWDLSRATGQDETLDPGFAAELLTGMESLDEVLRSSGQYGPKVEVPEDADVQTKLIAFIGRQP